MKKLLVGLLCMGVFSQVEAQVLECKAQVLTTMCGSGEIKVSIDLTTNAMKMRLGAVPCWGVDILLKGTAAVETSPRLFFKAIKYSLNGQRFREDPIKVGSLIVEKNIALLDLSIDGSQDYILYRSQFNLVCEEKTEPSGDLE